MGFEFAMLAFGCGAAALILFVAAWLLQLAVSIANRLVGPATGPVPSAGIAEWDWDDWDDEYVTSVKPVCGGRGGAAIPKPGVLKCAAILFATALACAVGFVLLGFAAEAAGLRMHRAVTRLAVALADLPITSIVMVSLLQARLPTTLWRAALVGSVYALILLALAAVYVSSNAS